MRSAAQAGAVLSSLLWVAGAVILVFIDIGRWRPPAGGLPEGWWYALTVLSVTTVVAAGWVTVATCPRASLGLSGSLACWLAPAAAGFGVTPSWARSIVLSVPPLLVALLTEVGTGLGGLRTLPAPWLRGATWLASGTASIALLLAYDPFGDPSCWRTCLSLPVPIETWPTIDAMRGVGVLLMVGTLCGLCAVAPGATSWAGRVRVLAVLLVGGGLAAVNMIPGQTPSGRRSLEGVTALALLLASVPVLLHTVAVVVRRREVEGLVRRLGDGALLDGVEFAVGSPTIWVDSQGRPPMPLDTASVLELADSRGPVARWRSSTGRRLPEDVVAVAQLHPAAWLTLDNARLAASTRALLLDLRASQRRIVTAADNERVRVGRDLHDRTQQRLVGASLHLRLAAGRADQGTAALLIDAEQRLRPALEALRGVARGPFPEVLLEEGLAVALKEWAADAHIAGFDCPDDLGRLPEEVERAAYAAVVSVGEAPSATVHLTRLGDVLSVSLRFAGEVEPHGLTIVGDRVGAVGGTLVVGDGGKGSTSVEVELPCGL